ISESLRPNSTQCVRMAALVRPSLSTPARSLTFGCWTKFLTRYRKKATKRPKTGRWLYERFSIVNHAQKVTAGLYRRPRPTRQHPYLLPRQGKAQGAASRHALDPGVHG